MRCLNSTIMCLLKGSLRQHRSRIQVPKQRRNYFHSGLCLNIRPFLYSYTWFLKIIIEERICLFVCCFFFLSLFPPILGLEVVAFYLFM